MKTLGYKNNNISKWQILNCFLLVYSSLAREKKTTKKASKRDTDNDLSK